MVPAAMMAMQDSAVILQPDYLIARIVHRTDAQALAVLARYGVPSYYPMVVELKSVPLRKLSMAQRNSGNRIQKPVKVPMLPRYVIIEDCHRRHDWGEIEEQSGIAGFACNENKMARIPASAIEKLKRENGEMIDGRKSARVVFELGEEIGITSGPFASFPGIVDEKLDVPIEELDPETRLSVLIDIFGRKTRTELEIWQVAKQ